MSTIKTSAKDCSKAWYRSSHNTISSQDPSCTLGVKMESLLMNCFRACNTSFGSDFVSMRMRNLNWPVICPDEHPESVKWRTFTAERLKDLDPNGGNGETHKRLLEELQRVPRDLGYEIEEANLRKKSEPLFTEAILLAKHFAAQRAIYHRRKPRKAGSNALNVSIAKTRKTKTKKAWWGKHCIHSRACLIGVWYPHGWESERRAFLAEQGIFPSEWETLGRSVLFARSYLRRISL